MDWDFRSSLKFHLRRAARRWHLYRSPSRIEKLENVSDPNGEKLARIIRRWRSGEAKPADDDWFGRIGAERQRLLRSNESLTAVADEEPRPWDQQKTISDVCKSSIKSGYALLLYLLIREYKPDVVLEFGTNLGVSASYQAAALKRNGRGKLVTLEASLARVKLAKDLHRRLGLDNVEYREGLFSDTIDETLDDNKPVGFAFIDGNHYAEPTLEYFDKVWKHASDGAIIVFDDIRWSKGMKQAWRTLRRDERIKIAVDLERLAVCLTSSHPSAVDRYVSAPIVY